MGLDNIPRTYACVAHETAIKDDEDRIDCQATQEAGGCPWKKAPNRPEKGAVLGMFGTDCWYRGKYGQYLLDEHGISTDPGFYGDNDDGSQKSVESCLELADEIDAALPNIPEGEDREGLIYASWYLRWAAAECGGLDAWY